MHGIRDDRVHQGLISITQVDVSGVMFTAKSGPLSLNLPSMSLAADPKADDADAPKPVGGDPVAGRPSPDRTVHMRPSGVYIRTPNALGPRGYSSGRPSSFTNNDRRHSGQSS